MKKLIYLDYAATTPLDQKVLKAMLPYLKKDFGNPSSSHSWGQRARAAIEKARENVARFLHAKPLEIIFTSGATEANNLAIKGVVNFQIQRQQFPKPHIITSHIEHESVLSPCQDLERQGLAEITYLPVNKEGIVEVEELKKAIKPNTLLVSIMYANSEIGTIQPIAEIGQLLNKLKTEGSDSKILFHTDAVQAAQFLDCNVQALGVDLLTLSAHKVYGPKGVGALYVREGIPLQPILMGGGQEQGLRSGTENVAGIVGMGQAFVQLQDSESRIQSIKIRHLRDILIKTILKRIPNSSLTGSKIKRLPNNAHFCFEGIEGRDLVIALDQKGIAVSTGSACSERTQEPSHVLLALDFTPREASSCIRITLGKYTKKEEIAKTVKIIENIIARLRKTKIEYKNVFERSPTN